MSDSLQALFRPNALAVIGASAKLGKLGFTIFKNILDAGFGGPVIPVNPKGETILGIPSVKSVDDIPSGTDLAVVIIPTASVPGTILQLGERKVRAAIVITGGFAESGPEGARLQEELSRNAARCGIRVVGPNCQGVNYPHHGLCASWPLITRKGAMAIASQSGTVGAALIDWAAEERLGFSAFVSMGNRVDVDEADLIEFFASDPNTKVITLYIEGVKNAGKFLAAVRACQKPIVVFKAGRTEQGRKAAESPTRSLAGKDEIYDAVFRQFGIHRATSLEELYDFSKALAYVPAPAGPRMLIVTSSGGSAIIATDVAADNGFRISPLPGPLAARLREVLPSHFIVGNPLDLTGDGDAERFRHVIAMARDHYDVVLTIFGDPIPGASRALEPGRSDLVAYLGGADVERAERLLFHEKGIAVFPTPERAVKAFSCHVRFARDRFPAGPCRSCNGREVPFPCGVDGIPGARGNERRPFAAGAPRGGGRRRRSRARLSRRGEAELPRLDAQERRRRSPPEREGRGWSPEGLWRPRRHRAAARGATGRGARERHGRAGTGDHRGRDPRSPVRPRGDVRHPRPPGRDLPRRGLPDRSALRK